ncbi:acyltransferase [Nocardioides sp. LHD-245]|uniref:acyltransferase family protein n=1 Tax=Nocardioides sp. LHD-245 TaxID=3051387 RepID=UPI0027DF7FA2|nr:acyltransferase [Nocardioides sp. LHD-245]
MSEHQHPGTQKKWLPGIEALRGVAALTVVFHHSWSLSSMPRFPGYWLVEGFGNWGVSLFFMLSGYLLAETFWQERRADLRIYAIRRFFRIAPAYYVNLTILFLFFARTHQVFSEQGAKQVAASYSFMHYLTPGTSSSLNVNGALWTLTIEMLLYAFLPILAIAVRYAPVISLVTIAGIGIGWRALVAFAGDGLREFYFGTTMLDPGIQSLFIARQFIGALAVFALGIGARWLVVKGHMGWLYRRIPRMSTTGFLLLAVPSLLLLRWVEEGSNYTNGWFFAAYDFLLMLLMVPALVLAAYPGEFRPSPLRTVSTWLGERSYSIYLWHFPIILAVYERGPFRFGPAPAGYEWRLPLILLLTLIFASVSYHTVERPGMEWGRRLARRFAAPTSTKEQAPS